MKSMLMIVIAVLSGLIGGMTGTVLVLHREKGIPQEFVSARRFQLIDEAGHPVSYWGLDKFHNPLLAFSPSGAQPSARVFSIDDPDSQRISIGLTGDGRPTLILRGNDDKTRASLWVSEYGKPFFLLHDDKSWRVSLGIRQSDTPGPQDNDWGLDFFPDRAGMGIVTVKQGDKSQVQGYLNVQRDRAQFP